MLIMQEYFKTVLRSKKTPKHEHTLNNRPGQNTHRLEKQNIQLPQPRTSYEVGYNCLQSLRAENK